MTPGMPPPSGDQPIDPQAEALEALAAGELDEETARTLEARLADEPRLAALYDQARRVERMLREEPLLPLPLHLVGRILEATAPPRARPSVLLARVAAVVLVFFASWMAFSGDVPAMEDVAPHPRLVASIEHARLPAELPAGLPPRLPGVDEVVSREPEPAAPAASTVGAVMTTAIGLILLVTGVAFALFSHLAAASRAADPSAQGLTEGPTEGDDA